MTQSSRFPVFVPAMFFLTACQGELGGGAPVELPPDPHAQSDSSEIVWTSVSTEQENLAFYALDGPSSDALVLVGERGRIFFWDGQGLSQVASVTLEDGDSPALNGVWTHTDALGTLVIVAGSRGTVLQGTLTNQGLDTSSLIRAETNTNSTLKGVYGFARDDIWAVGDGGAYRFDGEFWQRDTTLPGTSSLTAVWGTGSDDLYVIGLAEEGGSTLLHRTSQGWQRVALGFDLDLHGIWGDGSGSVFVVGQEGLILKKAGDDWVRLETDTFDHLWSVCGLLTGELFASGSNGSVLLFTEDTWQRLTTGSNRTLYGLWGADLTQVYSVGSWSEVLQYDPGTGADRILASASQRPTTVP